MQRGGLCHGVRGEALAGEPEDALIKKSGPLCFAVRLGHGTFLEANSLERQFLHSDLKLEVFSGDCEKIRFLMARDLRLNPP